MSVQAGAWNINGEPVTREFLATVQRELAEYCPDGETAYFDGPVGMLYLPFHTTSESRRERQPHISISGKVITWDGRLDNRDELLAQVQNDLTVDRSDVAIVMAAFELWGTDCFSKIIGDWALTVWDPREKELILARDYAGIRGLFYYPKLKRVIWCSHLAPLVLCGDEFTLSDEYFAGFLAHWPEAHLTPYKEIHSVPPGHFVRIQNGKVLANPYWVFDPRARIRYQNDAEYEEHFCHLFRQAVRRRLRTDSPILADLSGGLDSSAIVCMADDILDKEGAETPSVDTFSACDRDDPDEEDFRYFTIVEEKRGRIGHHADLEKLHQMSSFSFEDSRFVATPGFGLREEVKSIKAEILRGGRYRVLLSGIGGDEMLGQGMDPRVQSADLLRQLRFRKLAKHLLDWSLLLRRPWIHLFFEAVALQLPLAVRTRITEIAKLEPWVNRKFARKHRLSTRQLLVAEGSLFWLPSVRDNFHTLVALTRERTQSQPSTEETRYPYLDQNLVEYLMSIPTEQFLRPGQRRSLMRRALVGVLPPEILSRRTKSTGSRYLVVTLERNWDKVESILRSPFISRLGYVNQEQFHAALLDAKGGRLSYYFLRVLRALSWELWVRNAVARGVIRLSLT